MGRFEDSLEDEGVQGERRHGTEVQQMFGDSAGFDVSEVGEGLGGGRVGEPEAEDHDDGAEQQEHPGEAGDATPAAELELGPRSR